MKKYLFVLILAGFLSSGCQTISDYYQDNRGSIESVCFSIYRNTDYENNKDFKKCLTEMTNAQAQVHTKGWVKSIAITQWVVFAIGFIGGLL